MADYNKIIDFVYIPTGNTPNIDTEDILIGEDGFAYAHGVKFISENVIDNKISTAISDGTSGYVLSGDIVDSIAQINLTALKDNSVAGTVKFKGGGGTSISYDTTDGITITSTDKKTSTARSIEDSNLPILVNRNTTSTSTAGAPKYLLTTESAAAYINPSKATLYATNLYATTMQKNGVDVATVNDLNLAIASGIIYKGKIAELPTYVNGVRQGHAYIWNGNEDTYNKGDMLIAYTTGTNNTLEWSVVEHNIDDTAIQNAIGISQNGVVTLGNDKQDLFTYNGTHVIQAKVQRAGENLGIIGANPEQVIIGDGIAALEINKDGFGYITYNDRYLALTGGTLQNTSTTNNANITFPQTGNSGIRHINHGINGIIFNGSAENAYIKPNTSGALGILAYKGLYISTYNNDDWTIYHYNNSTYILQNGVWIKGSNAVITPQAYLDGGAFLSNKLVFKNNSALPKVASNPPFIVGLNSFSDGGYLTWTNKSDVSVGYATNATKVNIEKISVTTTNYPLLIKGANNDTDGNNTVRSTNSTHAYINPNDTTTELYADNILSKSVKVNGEDVLTSVPTATPLVTGGILASGTANNLTTLTDQTSNTDAKYYGVYVSSTGYGYVNVPWTDTKVEQKSASSNTNRPILLKYGNANTTTVTGQVIFDKDIYINPSTNTITAPNIVATSSIKVNDLDVLTSVPTATPSVTGGILASGTAQNSTTLTNQTSNTGAKYYGVYVSSTGYGYVNIPWTDTHYTSKTYLTNSSSGTSNVSNISNGSVHITHVENTSASASAVNSFVKIVGDGAVLAYVKEANTLTLYAANALSAQYAASTLTNEDLEPAIGDTFETAISKIHKAILDNEKVIALAINDLNDRLSELESKITGTPLNWKTETTV